MVERTITFGLGNIKVLVKRVIDHLWVTLGIKKTSFTVLDPKMMIIDLIRRSICKRTDWWPKNQKGIKLLSVVGAVGYFTYGDYINNLRAPLHSCFPHKKFNVHSNSTSMSR